MTRKQHPFEALAALRDRLPPGEPPAAKPAAAVQRGPARAVVRLERKGRGGKEATLVEKLDLGAAELDRWARELKTALGTGGGVEGGSIVLAGDCRARVEPLLLARGVRKVTRG